MSTTTPGVPGGPGRRTARSGRGRLDTTSVLAVLLPVATLASLFLVHVADDRREAARPTRTPLTTANLICPAPQAGSDEALLSTTRQGVHGKVTLRSGKDRSSARLASGTVTTVRSGNDPLVTTGTGDLAPGLVGARFGAPGHLAVATCQPTSPDEWFTGAGGAARHSSTLELVNPDAGPAVADVSVYGGHGVVDVSRLHGVSVPGRSSVELDLGELAPRRGDLALHVVTERGRIAASVLDGSDQLGGGARSQDWLPAQPAAATDNFLLGLPSGAAEQTLTVANGGDSEVRAQVKLVTADSVFTPEGMDPVRVPPQSAVRVSLSSVLDSKAADGALGLEVTASGPVSATLRSLVGGDLAHATAGPALRSGTSVIVPPGAKQLVLAGAGGVGAVTVVARSATGKELDSTRAEVRPGQGAAVDLPAGARLVSVTPGRSPVHAAVVMTGSGAAVVPLSDPVLNGLVPDVRPGLPQ
jgi:hypothetical protein